MGSVMSAAAEEVRGERASLMAGLGTHPVRPPDEEEEEDEAEEAASPRAHGSTEWGGAEAADVCGATNGSELLPSWCCTNVDDSVTDGMRLAQCAST